MFLCVDPTAYLAASQIFGQRLAEAVGRVGAGLDAGLSDTARIAGHDPAGASWGVAYDTAAGSTVRVIADPRDAALNIGALLQASGFNHARAEAYSNVTGGGELPAESLTYRAGFGGCAAVPSSAGGAIPDPPPGWELIVTVQGMLWPDGDPEKLRAVSDVWNTAADGLDDCGPLVSDGIAALAAQESPEIEQARVVCRSLGDAITEISAQCRAIAQSAADQAAHIDEARTDIRSELVAFVALTVLIEGVAVIAAPTTGGIGTVGMQFVEGAEVANAAARVAAILARLFEAADVAGRAMTVRTLDTVGDGLRVVIARVPVLADSTAVAGSLKSLDLTASRLAESPWLLPPSPRGIAIETRLGHNLPPSFPVIDVFDDVTGVATSIKSIDLGAKTYQDSGRLGRLIQKYIDSVAGFKGAYWSGKEIFPEEIARRVLQVATPRLASADQARVLDEMAAYARSRGVDFVVEVVR